MRRLIFLFFVLFFSPNEQRARGGGGRCQTLFFFFFPCSADHERDWRPCKVVFFGLATNALNVRNNNNNNNYNTVTAGTAINRTTIIVNRCFCQNLDIHVGGSLRYVTILCCTGCTSCVVINLVARVNPSQVVAREKESLQWEIKCLRGNLADIEERSKAWTQVNGYQYLLHGSSGR